MTRLPPSLWLIALALAVSSLTQPGSRRAERRARPEVHPSAALVAQVPAAPAGLTARVAAPGGDPAATAATPALVAQEARPSAEKP
ncbi:MAG: hypothetical protein IPO09_14695 [Anaeromyxobacter sp.]|nr:hypothetical protein [Anaeromyxobacter sp.]MBL0276913.1 hypothetical protein [Anaeromyxobacter sp.]